MSNVWTRSGPLSVHGSTVAESVAGPGQEVAWGTPVAAPIHRTQWGSTAMPAMSRTNTFRILAVAGWGYALAAWGVLGEPAGIDPGFILGACCGITFSLSAVMCRVLPESQAVYALGFREGQCSESDTQPPEPLSLVR